MKSTVQYSLVIPCYNESSNLPELVQRCHSVLDRDDTEIILVDNGSTDNSPHVLEKLLQNQNQRIRSKRVKQNKGYGHGILAGLGASSGNVVGWTHADLQTDPKDFLTAVSIFEEEPEDKKKRMFIKGTRYGRPVRDKVFTWGMAFSEWLILGTRMWDINSQPTVLHRSFFDRWQNPPNDFSLDLYAYHQAVHSKLDVRRIPVHFGPRLSGVGHNETLRAKLKNSRRTFEYSIKLRRHVRRSN